MKESGTLATAGLAKSELLCLESAALAFAHSDVDGTIYQRRREVVEDSGFAVEVAVARTAEFRAKLLANEVDAFLTRSSLELGGNASRFVTDMRQVCRWFSVFIERDRMTVRIQATTKQSCPKFHVDRTHTRLIATYAGLGTEFQVAGETYFERAPLYALVLLKGTLHPTFRGQVLHRSPEVPPSMIRLCLVVDVDA